MANPFDQFDEQKNTFDQFDVEQMQPTQPTQLTVESLEGMQEIGAAPELNELSWPAFKSSLGLLLTGDTQEGVDILKQQFPDASFETVDDYAAVTLPSGTYALNKPGVSGQDIAKGIFDIAAFTPAGSVTRSGLKGAAEVGLKSAGTQAVMEQGQESLGGEFDPSDIALAGALGGVGQTIGDKITKLAQSSRNSVDDWIRDADIMGVDVMTTDVVEPKTWFGRWVADISEKIPLFGTGAQRQAQQQQRVKAVEDALDRFNVSEGMEFDQEIVNSLKAQTKQTAQRAGEGLNRIEGALGDTNVPMTNFKETVQTELERLGKQGGAADSQLVNYLNGLNNTLETNTYETVKAIRGGVGSKLSDVKRGAGELGSNATSIMNKLYSSLSKDMSEHIKQELGEDMLRRWKVYNGAYADVAKEVGERKVRNTLAGAETTPENVSRLILSNKPSDNKRLYRNLTPEGRENVKAKLMQHVIETSGGFDNINPTRIANKMQAYRKNFGEFFKGPDLSFIKGLQKTLDVTKQAQQSANLPSTGEKLLPFAAAGGAAVDLGSTLAAMVGAGGLGRLYQSKPIRNAMIKLSKVDVDSKEYVDTLNKIMPLINAQLQATREQL